MRLWSLHPALLDRQGLVACWREALLAQAVLLGRTQGYVHHPQLERFRAHQDPPAAAAAFLQALWEDSQCRGYRFDATRIATDLPRGPAGVAKIPVTAEQLDYEWQHLLSKLARRSPSLHTQTLQQKPSAHPLFEVVPGPIAPWEQWEHRS